MQGGSRCSSISKEELNARLDDWAERRFVMRSAVAGDLDRFHMTTDREC